jgi:hypothetical protein
MAFPHRLSSLPRGIARSESLVAALSKRASVNASPESSAVWICAPLSRRDPNGRRTSEGIRVARATFLRDPYLYCPK